VAVVGAGHVPGIKILDAEIDLAALDAPAAQEHGWPAIAQMDHPRGHHAALRLGVLRRRRQAGSDMIMWWVAANGLLAGIGALVAWGHPLTVLSRCWPPR
jgi:pheromone shutdown protein TraB